MRYAETFDGIVRGVFDGPDGFIPEFCPPLEAIVLKPGEREPDVDEILSGEK